MEARKIFFLTVFPLVFLFHLSNSLLIITRRNLQSARYYMLINLSLSDVFMLIIVLTQHHYSNTTLLTTFHTICFTASLLSVFGMTIERFIAVKYCLRYQSIVTNGRVVCAVVVFWITSGVLALLPYAIEDLLARSLINDAIHFTLYTAVSLSTLYLALYVRHTRDFHEEKIRKRQRQFGIQDEQLNILRKLSVSVVDMIKLNIITSLLVNLSTVVFLLWKYFYRYQNADLMIAMQIIWTVYAVSNPLIYALTMTSLKNEYKKLSRSTVEIH